MAGKQNLIHGYNKKYQLRDGDQTGLPFQSFEPVMKGARLSIDKFVNRIVVQEPPAAQALLDHQGHIVPQQTMNVVLDPLMIAMSAACNSEAALVAYINDAANKAAWFAPVLAYARACGITLFDFAEAAKEGAEAQEAAETRLGNLFSIVTWNPVHICRAPDDLNRGKKPGNSLDAAVVGRLNQHSEGIDPQWLSAVNVLASIGAPQGADAIRTYLAASTATLSAQQQSPTGYYTFPWKLEKDGALVPVE